MVKNLGKIVSGLAARVKSAGAHLLLLTLNRQNTASRIVAIERIDVSTENPLVFDLSVYPQRCYLANGLLVSNSDAFQILAVGMKRAMSVVDGYAPGEDLSVSGFGSQFDDDRPLAEAWEGDDGVF